MRCSSCGTENPAEAAFCSNCGIPLEREDAPASERPEPPPPTPEPPTPQPTPEPPTPQPTPEPTPSVSPWEERLRDPEPPTPQPTPEPPTPQPTPEPPTPQLPEPPAAEPRAAEPPAAEPPAAEPRAAEPPARGGGGALLAAGWRKALGRGLLAFVLVALLGQAVAFYATLEDPGAAPVADVARGGGVLFYSFHHAGITVRLPQISIPAGEAPFTPPISTAATLAVALMLGTAIAAWLLYRGGRAVAESAGGSRWERGIHGAKVAVPYALAAFGFSFLIRFEVPLPPLPFFEEGQPVELFPAPVTALVWPLVLGVLAGGLGGARTARDDSVLSRRIAGIVSGGWRMAVYALAFAFIGYLIRVALSPDDPLPFSAQFFQAVVEGGLVEGGFLLLVGLLIVPNIAVLVLVPAMGGALGFFGGGFSCSLFSYTRFPAGAIEGDPTGLGFADPCALIPVRFETAPAAYFLFLLVPLVATVLGGRRAARRSEAATTTEGAGIGALAGVAYALFVVLLAVLASASVTASGAAGGFVGVERLFVGPALALGGMLALAWGAAGGALGGATGVRSVPVPEGEVEGLWQEETTPQEAPAGAPGATEPVAPPTIPAAAPVDETQSLAGRPDQAETGRQELQGEEEPKAKKPKREKKPRKAKGKREKRPKTEKVKGEPPRRITGFEPDAPLPPPRREPPAGE